MRTSAVAGSFYPANPKNLKEKLKNCFSGIDKKDLEGYLIKGAVVPHAGYDFSGRVAAHVYANLPKVDTYILVGPKHHFYGSPIAFSDDTWETPYGTVEVDLDITNQFIGSIIDKDEIAHQYEHSIEVQLPFLQYLFSDFKIVPICIGLHDPQTCMEVGRIIAQSLKNAGKNAVIIASSDFTHAGPNYGYYPPRGVKVNKFIEELDKKVIQKIIELKEREVIITAENDRSMCGSPAVAATITAVKELGAKRVELLKYATSYDVMPSSSAVGYAGIILC